MQPFRSAHNPSDHLNGLGFQIGGSSGRQNGTLPTFKTSVGQTFFSYATGLQPTAIDIDVSPALFYYYKAFGGFRGVHALNAIGFAAGHCNDVHNQGWDITDIVSPDGRSRRRTWRATKFNFDPAAGRWGALQLVGRYTVLDSTTTCSRLAWLQPTRAA